MIGVKPFFQSTDGKGAERKIRKLEKQSRSPLSDEQDRENLKRERENKNKNKKEWRRLSKK